MINIIIDSKAYNDFAFKFWRVILDGAIDDWIKKSIFKLQEKVQDEQIAQKVYDKWVLANSYQTEFSSLYWKLENSRLYWLFQHEGFKLRNGKMHKWRPWITDALSKNEDIAEDTINDEITNTIKKFLW